MPSLVVRLATRRRVLVLDRLKGRGANGSNSEKIGLGSIRRPVIGLALGGGAARGFAHIGIIRTLLANGIVPDVVVGTSIGAVVGGLYASGKLDTLEEWGRGLQGMRNILGYLDIRLNGSWLTRGRVVDAMRASYALPGIFSPVLIGDRWLVDGALVNPVPVSAARALGAEIVIAANLSSDIFTYSTTVYSHGAAPGPAAPAAEETTPKRRFPRFFSPEKTVKREFFGGGDRPGLSSVMVDAFNIMQDRITRARLAGDPPDLLITPRVGQFGWFDFHRTDDLIALGTRAAERALDSIQEAIHALAPPPEGAAPKAGE